LFIGHKNADDRKTIEEEFGDQGKSEDDPFILKLLRPLPSLSEEVCPPTQRPSKWTTCPPGPTIRYFVSRYDDSDPPDLLPLDSRDYMAAGRFSTVGDLKASMVPLTPGASGPSDVVLFIGHKNADDRKTIEEEFGDQGKTADNPFIQKLPHPLPSPEESAEFFSRTLKVAAQDVEAAGRTNVRVQRDPTHRSAL